MVAGHAVGAHRPELLVEPGPELLQAHVPTLTRRGARAAAHPAYARDVIPGTGNDALDTVLEIGIALALVVTLVLLIKNYRDR